MIKDFENNALTVPELFAFEKELEEFRVRKTLSTGKEVSFIDFDTYLKKQGALNQNGAIIIPESTVVRVNGVIKEFLETPRYHVLMDKIEQFQKWKAGRDFAKKQQLLNLQNSSNQQIYE